MSARRWTLSVRDGRGRIYDGTVTYGDRLPPPRRSILAGEAFRIALLTRPRDVDAAPEATAICVPGVRAIHAVGKRAALEFPERIEQLTLPPQEMRAFASGTIVMSPPNLVEPADIFPVHSEHPRLDRLGRALVEVQEAEAVASYLAVIRHELRLPAGADALAALEARLSPPDGGARPPARAPAVGRLKAAAKELRRGFAPDGSLEELVDDLQFLQLFAADTAPLPADALGRLLDDLTETLPKRPAKPRRGGPARVIQFPARKDE